VTRGGSGLAGYKNLSCRFSNRYERRSRELHRYDYLSGTTSYTYTVAAYDNAKQHFGLSPQA